MDGLQAVTGKFMFVIIKGASVIDYILKEPHMWNEYKSVEILMFGQ